MATGRETSYCLPIMKVNNEVRKLTTTQRFSRYLQKRSLLLSAADRGTASSAALSATRLLPAHEVLP